MATAAIFHDVLHGIKSKWHERLMDNAAQTRKQSTGLVAIARLVSAAFGAALACTALAAASPGQGAECVIVWRNVECLRHYWYDDVM